jgi:hypothetical protein
MIAHLPPFFDLADQNIDQWIDVHDVESDIYLIREHGTDAITGLMFLAPAVKTIFILGIFFGNPRGEGYASELLDGLVRTCPRLVCVCLGVVVVKTSHPRMCCEKQVFILCQS